MSFSWKEYSQELKAVVKGWWPTTLVKRLATRSFYRPSFDEVVNEKRSSSTAEMKRTLTGLDLLMFGVGAPPPPPNNQYWWPPHPGYSEQMQWGFCTVHLDRRATFDIWVGQAIT